MSQREDQLHLGFRVTVEKIRHCFSPFTLPRVASSSRAQGRRGMCLLSRSPQARIHVYHREVGRRCATDDRQACEAKQVSRKGRGSEAMPGDALEGRA